MDGIDLGILEALNENARLTASEISKRVNLSIPAVTERIRKLEKTDIIQRYTTKLNHEQMGFHLMVTIFVSIEHSTQIQEFKERIVSYNEVLECHHIVGEYDYILKVLLKNSSELELFISKKLKAIPGIQRSNTILMLSTIKDELNRQVEVC